MKRNWGLTFGSSLRTPIRPLLGRLITLVDR